MCDLKEFNNSIELTKKNSRLSSAFVRMNEVESELLEYIISKYAEYASSSSRKFNTVRKMWKSTYYGDTYEKMLNRTTGRTGDRAIAEVVGSCVSDVGKVFGFLNSLFENRHYEYLKISVNDAAASLIRNIDNKRNELSSGGIFDQSYWKIFRSQFDFIMKCVEMSRVMKRELNELDSESFANDMVYALPSCNLHSLDIVIRERRKSEDEKIDAIEIEEIERCFREYQITLEQDQSQDRSVLMGVTHPWERNNHNRALEYWHTYQVPNPGRSPVGHSVMPGVPIGVV